jgi:hypothetical protein
MKPSLLVLASLFSLTLHAQVHGPGGHLIPGNSNPPPPIVQPPDYQNLSSYSILQYNQLEQEAVAHQKRYNQASSGSWEEKQAKQNRDQAIQNALSVIGSPQVFSGMDIGSIENFIKSLVSKYNSSSSGSALESLYKQSLNRAYPSYENEIALYIESIYESKELINFGNHMSSKYNQASSGSALEGIYKRAFQKAFQLLPQLVFEENTYAQDFRQIESVMNEYAQKYNVASSGSVQETAYKKIRQSSADQAVALFQNQARYMSRNELSQIQNTYHQKYNVASSGSPQESFAKKIRDIARSYLN